MKSTNASTKTVNRKSSKVKKNNNTPQAPARPNQEGTMSSIVDAELKSRTTDGVDIETVNVKELKNQHKAQREILKTLMEEEFRLKNALLKSLEYAGKVNFPLIHLVNVENGEISDYGAVIEFLKLDKAFKNRFDKVAFFAPVVSIPVETETGTVNKVIKTGKKFEVEANAKAAEAELLKTFKSENKHFTKAYLAKLTVSTEEGAYKDKFSPLLIQRTLQNLELRAIKANNARINTRLDLRTANVAQISRLITAG